MTDEEIIEFIRYLNVWYVYHPHDKQYWPRITMKGRHGAKVKAILAEYRREMAKPQQNEGRK